MPGENKNRYGCASQVLGVCRASASEWLSVVHMDAFDTWYLRRGPSDVDALWRLFAWYSQSPEFNPWHYT